MVKRAVTSTIVFLLLVLSILNYPSCAEEKNVEIEKIVSLAPSNTEILFALGLGEKVVGVTDYCNYPEEAKRKEKIGGYSTVDIEKVVLLKPDLVLAAYGNGEEVVKRLKELGLNVAVVSSKPETCIEDTLKEIKYVGKITGKEKEALSLYEEMENKIKEITDRTRDAKKVRVTHICWHEPIYVAGAESLQEDILEKAGGENVFSDKKGWHTVSLEELITKNPEVIIVSSGAGMGGEEDVAYNYILEEERLKSIDAVKNNRVYLIDADIIDRSGPRIVDALEDVAKFIHPEIYSENAQ
ncbi:MAG: cobalamin-binding protein [Candidatus Methanoliparum thermophilum]|uniref:Cobalamin-binding protein n=1 Tax=Methanoliparum thermophilum TaxID=2491083 RepID=A0A520KT19_METT2|nr:cobalamin-binding protein [Candidatus Methanoliparum sp. LAM-1]RZN65061.1 MAG: cobalamin-binding protein [Candidatus Methanoliparum thermophilum]BDC36046.1 ABC transporter substrate-binding protein [Candidatus Methanoliparum sp. LAM-1]